MSESNLLVLDLSHLSTWIKLIMLHQFFCSNANVKGCIYVVCPMFKKT